MPTAEHGQDKHPLHPSELGTTDPTLGFNWSEEATRTLTSLFDAIDSLAVIQRHTSAVIRVPDLAAIPPGQAKDRSIAARILRGEEVPMAYPEGHCIIVVLDTGIAAPEGEFGITTPSLRWFEPNTCHHLRKRPAS